MSASKYKLIPGTGLTFTRETSAGGTWLQHSDLGVPYSRIVEVFGDPEEGDGYKAAFEWSIKFGDGTVATIYDYKETSLYDSDLPEPETLKKGFTEWHIGGRDKRAVELVVKALNEAKV